MPVLLTKPSRSNRITWSSAPCHRSSGRSSRLKNSTLSIAAATPPLPVENSSQAWPLSIILEATMVLAVAVVIQWAAWGSNCLSKLHRGTSNNRATLVSGRSRWVELHHTQLHLHRTLKLLGRWARDKVRERRRSCSQESSPGHKHLYNRRKLNNWIKHLYNRSNHSKVFLWSQVKKILLRGTPHIPKTKARAHSRIKFKTDQRLIGRKRARKQPQKRSKLPPYLARINLPFKLLE